MSFPYINEKKLETIEFSVGGRRALVPVHFFKLLSLPEVLLNKVI